MAQGQAVEREQPGHHVQIQGQRHGSTVHRLTVRRSCSTALVAHQLIASSQNETEMRWCHQWLYRHRRQSNQRADPSRWVRGPGKLAGTSSEALMEMEGVCRGTEAAVGAWRVPVKDQLKGLVWPPPQLAQLDRCRQ